MYIEESPCPERGSLFTLCSSLRLSHIALLSIYTHTGCGKVSREQGNNLMSLAGSQSLQTRDEGIRDHWVSPLPSPLLPTQHFPAQLQTEAEV